MCKLYLISNTASGDRQHPQTQKRWDLSDLEPCGGLQTAATPPGSGSAAGTVLPLRLWSFCLGPSPQGPGRPGQEPPLSLSLYSSPENMFLLILFFFKERKKHGCEREPLICRLPSAHRGWAGGSHSLGECLPGRSRELCGSRHALQPPQPGRREILNDGCISDFLPSQCPGQQPLGSPRSPLGPKQPVLRGWASPRAAGFLVTERGASVLVPTRQEPPGRLPLGALSAAGGGPAARTGNA